ncbi:hypothetical protein T03_18026, partial [Trichinella britovi]
MNWQAMNPTAQELPLIFRRGNRPGTQCTTAVRRDTHDIRPGDRILLSFWLTSYYRADDNNGVKLLAQSNCWCGDGKFKIVPSWYQQLFTLHVFLR